MATLQDQYFLDVTAALTQLMTVEAAMNRIATQHNINLQLVGVQGMLGQVGQLQAALNGLGTRTINIAGLQGGMTPQQVVQLTAAVTALTQQIREQTAASAEARQSLTSISPARDQRAAHARTVGHKTAYKSHSAA